MICEKCGQEFKGNFCPNCGTPARAGLDLFEDDAIFDSIESNILSDADAEYKREVGSAVIRSGEQSGAYAYEEEPEHEPEYEPDYEDDYDYEGHYEDDYDYDYDESESDYRSGGGRIRKKERNRDLSKPDLARSGKQIRKGISNASSAVGKGARTALDFLFRLMKWASGLLMLATAVQLFRGFWAERSTLGSMTGFIYEKNYPEEAYLIVAACVILFALIQFFWIMSSQRGMRLGMVRHIDTGRGLCGFAIYLILGIVSVVIVHIIPSRPSALIGVKQVFSVISNLPRAFLVTNFFGMVLCFLRKLNRRM